MNPLLQIASKFRQWAIPRKPPRVLLEEEQIHELMKSRTAAARFAKRLIEQLQTYPHFVILKRTSFVGDGAPIERLVKAIARTPPLKAGQTAEDRPQLEVSRIDVNIEKSAETHLTTRYSRTNQALALHTDDSFRLEPRELVVFDFVQADPQGGDSLLAAVEDVVAALDDATKNALTKPMFPFGCGDQPVLWENGGLLNIRYSRLQIDKTRAGSEDKLTERDVAAMDTLDRVLSNERVLFQAHVQPGETLLLHNTKVLHGRTGFSSDSKRLMYRVRVPVGCLG